MKRLYDTIFKVCLIAGIAIGVYACKGGGAAADSEDAAVSSQTPVQVTTIDQSDMANYLDLNAVSTYLKKSYVKANAIGYIQQSLVQPGQYVTKGQLLFTLKTKEAQSIGNSINVLDTTFKFSGVNRIKASASGYVTQLNHQPGDYVQDGEQLAIINESSSFCFLMQLPYELSGTLKNNQSLPLTLPDGQKLTAMVSSIMPSVDTAAQTQGIVLKVNSPKPIPENLIAKAHIIRTLKNNTLSLPKSAVLSNETQTDFWVMKVTNDSTAVKVSVKKGIETADRIEILSPTFNAKDQIITTGNYSLADTAKIKIVKQ